MHKEKGMATTGTVVSIACSSLALDTALGLEEPKPASCSSARTDLRHVQLLGLGTASPHRLWCIVCPWHQRARRCGGPQCFVYVVPQSLPRT